MPSSEQYTACPLVHNVLYSWLKKALKHVSELTLCSQIASDNCPILHTCNIHNKTFEMHLYLFCSSCSIHPPPSYLILILSLVLFFLLIVRYLFILFLFVFIRIPFIFFIFVTSISPVEISTVNVGG